MARSHAHRWRDGLLLVALCSLALGPPLCCIIPPLPPAMPAKGKAFDKPSVNAHHKQAVRTEARLFAAASAGSEDALIKDLSDIVTAENNLSQSRQTDALRCIGEAVRKLRAGKDPEMGLRPPPDCQACKGRHKPHHFLCLKRDHPPSGAEGPIRSRVQKRLRAEWRQSMYDEQTVSARLPPSLLRSCLALLDPSWS